MKRIVAAVMLVLLTAVTTHAAALTFADLEPAKGDKGAFRITEESSMTFENTPVKMSSKGSGLQTSEVVAISKGGKTTAYLVLSSHSMKRTRTPSGKEESTVSYTLESCRVNPNGVYVDANVNFENGEEDSVDLGKRVLQIRLPCAIGTSWRVGRLEYKDGFILRPQSQAVAFETVEVPAGAFENCLKVVSVCPRGIEGYIDQDGQKLSIISSDMEVTTWYYPRVGIVKETTHSVMGLQPEGREQAAVLKMDTTTNMELMEYKLGKK